MRFGAKTAVYYRDEVEFPFFNYWLKGKGAEPKPKAWVFETGTNQWRELDAWPPKAAHEKTFYLAPSAGRAGRQRLQ